MGKKYYIFASRLLNWIKYVKKAIKGAILSHNLLAERIGKVG